MRVPGMSTISLCMESGFSLQGFWHNTYAPQKTVRIRSSFCLYSFSFENILRHNQKTCFSQPLRHFPCGPRPGPGFPCRSSSAPPSHVLVNQSNFCALQIALRHSLELGQPFGYIRKSIWRFGIKPCYLQIGLLAPIFTSTASCGSELGGLSYVVACKRLVFYGRSTLHPLCT